MSDTTNCADAGQVALALRWLSPAQRSTLLTGVGHLNTCINLRGKGLAIGVEPLAGERRRWSPVLSPLGEAVREQLFRRL
jgi:hypothetical protein